MKNLNVRHNCLQKKIFVDNLKTPVRIDIYCSDFIKGITRSKLKTGIKKLLLNSKKAKLSSYVRNGDVIDIDWENPVPNFCEPQNIPLKIIYEDKNIIVLNKPSGMVTHPANGNWNATLVNALNYYRLFISQEKDEFACLLNEEKEKLEDSFRLGIVHRLDKDTSGVIITARNFKTQEFLKQEFKNRNVKKYYLAILDGVPQKKFGVIKTAVFRKKNDRKKFTTSDDLSKGKIAYSAYKVLKHNARYSFVMFRIFTGRTHQIRLHAKHIGCPIVGDLIYGKKNVNNKNCKLLLHAYKLIVNTSDTEIGKREFKAKIPSYFLDVLRNSFYANL